MSETPVMPAPGPAHGPAVALGTPPPPPSPPPAPRRGGPRRVGGRRGAVVWRRYRWPVLLVAALAVAVAVLPAIPSSPPSGTPAPVEITPAPAPGAAGVAVSGVSCAPGVRQVPWSHYAPLCVPAWHGDNGGATAPGVTATTITLTERELSSLEASQLSALLPPSVTGTSQQSAQTVEAYVATFNARFELYGRQVVVRPFVGRGDVVAELSGAGTRGARADARRAAALHGFADASAFEATPTYLAALARHHVVGLGVADAPDRALAAGSPYLYTTGVACSKTAAATVQLVTRSLAGGPPAFAGTGADGGRRVFGLVDERPSGSAGCTAALRGGLRRAGIRVVTVGPLSLGSPTFAADVGQAVAELKSAGVTTVLCTTCGPFTPAFLTRAADNLGYEPEWVESSGLDALGALEPPAESRHTLAIGLPAVPPQATEAQHAFDLGAPAGAQAVPAAATLYGPVLLFFDALQAAGPDLTPATFQRALRRLPASLPGGMFGAWSFGPGSFDPNANFSVLRFDPGAPSALNGALGAWVVCNGGARYAYSGTPGLTPGQALQCPPVTGGG